MSHSYTAALRWVVWRDVTLAWRRRSDLFATLFFFVMAVSLFPLGIGSDTRLLRSIGPGIVWVTALLASMLSLGRLFTEDHADGTLEQMALGPHPIYLVVLGKVLAQWLVAVAPLVVIAPLIGVQFDLPFDATLVLAASLLLGTPVVLLVGAVGAALTLGLRGAGTLTWLIVMPLYVPTVVFGAGAVQAVLDGASPGPGLKLLTSLLIVAVMFGPWAAAAALRIALE